MPRVLYYCAFCGAPIFYYHLDGMVKVRTNPSGKIDYYCYDREEGIDCLAEEERQIGLLEGKDKQMELDFDDDLEGVAVLGED